MNIELFPCSGGFAEGFRRAGIVFDLAIEKDTDACDSYEKNHGHRPVQMDALDFLRMVRAGWRPPGGVVDFLCADPPCTPWSRAGKREGLDDPRDCLAATAELIALLRPRAYLIGNVPGLQDSTSWGVVQKVIGGLAREGYCVKDYASLDAADYGVPQHRVRPFWFGHLDGPCIRWPEPTHAAASGQIAIGGAALAPWVTCRQSLQHLSLEELGRPVRMKIRDAGEDGTKNGGDVTRCSAPDKVATTVMARQHRKGGQIMITGAEPTAPAGKKRWLPNGGDESLCSAPDKPASTVGAHEGIKGGQVLFVNDRCPALLVNDKHPMSRIDEPAMTVTSHLGATGAAQGGAALFVGAENPRHPISDLDDVSRTVRTNGGRAAGAASMLRLPELVEPRPDCHPISEPDEPSKAIVSSMPGNGGSVMRLPDPNRPPTSPEAPARTVTAQSKEQNILTWPWDRPATTILGDERLSVPGHHDAGVGNSSHKGPNAVVLSERAAAILQGFPEGWTFAGATKRARWSQIGQAMPPPLAHSVAESVTEQMGAARVTSSGATSAREGK